MILPTKEFVFVIEDKLSDVKEGSELQQIGFVAGEKNAGTSGVVKAVPSSLWYMFRRGGNKFGIKEGDRVVFSKFAAEQLDLYEDGKLVENLLAVPLDAVLGFIQ